MNKFWLVWNEKGQIPRVKHLTKESARAEAERLCRKNPGMCFYLLGLEDIAQLDDIAWVSDDGCECDCCDDDETGGGV